MSEPHFYYIRKERNNQIHPYITVCVFKNADGTVNRGVAVCSVKDNFDREKGKAIAYNRVISAQKNGYSICPSDGRYAGFEFFGELNATPTKEEYRMLTPPAKNYREDSRAVKVESKEL